MATAVNINDKYKEISTPLLLEWLGGGGGGGGGGKGGGGAPTLL